MNPLHPEISMHFLYTDIYTFTTDTDKEHLSNNQELLGWVVISYILITLLLDSVVIKQREISHWSLSGVKGLTPNCTRNHVITCTNYHWSGIDFSVTDWIDKENWGTVFSIKRAKWTLREILYLKIKTPFTIHEQDTKWCNWSLNLELHNELSEQTKIISRA